jgi:hypothetical protein
LAQLCGDAFVAVVGDARMIDLTSVIESISLTQRFALTSPGGRGMELQ